MAEPAFRVHRIARTAAHRVHSVQCLNDDGVVIALAATQGGDDYGLAICGPSSTGWTIKSVAAVQEPDVRSINVAGRFVGWSLKAGRERALVGQAEPLALDVWPGFAALTAIDDSGRMAGFRRARNGVFRAFLRDGERDIELQAPSEVGLGCCVTAFAGDRIAGLVFDQPRAVLMWDASGKLVDQFESEFGELIGANAAGQLLCAYGVIHEGAHTWLPNAPRCSDFVARDLNAQGNVVGYGRALDRDVQAHACLSRGGVSYNLNDLVNDAQAQLREAHAINNRDWIACSDAEGDAVLLEPLTT